MPYVSRQEKRYSPGGQVYYVTVKVWVQPAPSKPKPKPRSRRRTPRPRPVVVGPDRERQRLLAEQNRRIAQRKREFERSAAERRRRLYDLITTRQKARLADQRAALNRNQEATAARLEAESQRRVEPLRGSYEAPPRTAGDLARTEALERAKKAPDGIRVELERMRRRQIGTGGRYLDKKTYGDLLKLYSANFEKATADYDSYEKKIRAAAKKGDYTAARAILSSKEWKAVLRQAVAYFGDGRKPGEAQRIAALMNNISKRNDEYITRAVLAMSSQNERATAEEVAVQIQNRMLREARGPGSQSLGVDPTSFSLKDYLDKVEAQRLVQERKVLKDYVARRSLLMKEGYDPDTGRNIARDKYRDRISLVLKSRGHDADKLFKDLYEGDQVDRQRAFKAIRGIMLEEREERLRSSMAGGPRSAGYQRALRGLPALDRELYENLLGTQAPGALEQSLGDLMSLPVLHEAMTGLGVLSGGVFGLVRRAQLDMFGLGDVNKSFGRISGPDLQLSELWEGRMPFRLGEGRTDAEEVAHEIEAWNELHRVGQSGDLGKVLEGIAGYGAEPFQSNILNVLGPTVLDPLNFIGPARYLGRARLAAREVGGLSPGNLAQVTRRVNEFLKDGGKYRSAKLLNDLNRKHGTNFKTLADVDELVVEAERINLLKHPEKVKDTKHLERLWKGKAQPDSRQLVTSVARAIEDYLGSSRIAKDLQVQGLIRRADEAVRKGERRLHVRQEKLTSAQDLARGERALADVRVSLGRRGATAPPVVPTARRRAVERRVTDYQRLDDEFRQGVKDTKAAVEILRDPRAKAQARRQAYEELSPLLDLLDEFHTPPLVVQPKGAGRSKVVRGRFDVADETLNRTFAQAGMPRLGARLVGPKALPRAIARDIRDVEGLIKTVRAQLSAATTPAARNQLREQLRDLGAARRHLDREKVRAQGRSVVASEVVRRYAKRAEAGVPSKRLGARVQTREGAEQEFIRDLHTTYRGATADPNRPVSPLTSVQERQLASAKVELTAKAVVINATLEPYRAVFEGLNVWQALHVVELSDVDFPYWVAQQIHHQARSDRLTAPQIWDLAKREHHGTKAALGDYEKFDAALRKAFQARDRFRRKGQLDFRQRVPRGGTSRVHAGSEQVQDLLDKLAVAEAEGLTVFAYDDLRGVFRKDVLRRNSAFGLQKRTAGRVAKGETFDEAWEKELSARVTYEAVNDLERFAMHPRFDNMTASEIWEVFEDMNLESDLTFSAPEFPEWAVEQLCGALMKQTGLQNVDDLNQMRRALGGVVDPPPGARLPTPDELDAGLAGLNTAVPIFVVPNTSKHLLINGNWSFAGHGQPFGILVGESNIANPAVVLHEVGHALVHQSLTVNDFAVRNIRAMVKLRFGKLTPDEWETILGYKPGSLEEAMVELYGRWASGDRPLVQSVLGAAPEPVTNWPQIRRAMEARDPFAAGEFDTLEHWFGNLQPQDAKNYGVVAAHVPPFWDRPRLYQWLLDNGYWQKRTADKIRSGSRVWSIAEERLFFESRFGFTPAWTDRNVLEKILDDPAEYDEFWESVGVLDNGYEVKASSAHLDSPGMKEAQAFGDEAAGLKRRRSPEEQRRWFAQRYGDLVSKDGDGLVLTAAPWLMDPTQPEYLAWVARVTDENVPQSLVQGSERVAYLKAVEEAVRRYVERAKKRGDIDLNSVFLPEEQMRLALDVVDELLYTKAWRSKWTTAGKLGSIANLVGDLQRLTVTFSIPFVLVNVIERFTFRPAILALRQGKGVLRPFLDPHAAEMIPSLSAVNLRQRGLWEFRTAGGWTRAKAFGLRDRRALAELAKAVKDSPFSISTLGEDAMKLRFARNVFMDVRRDLLKEGASEALADSIAMREARRLSLLNFPSLEDASELEKAFNQIVPFLSYNYRTTRLYISTVYQHPGFLTLADRLGRIVEQENREAWEKEHPGMPFPEKDARALRLRIGDFEYAIDLTMFSDVLRAGDRLFGQDAPTTAFDAFKKLIRIPHPIQAGFYALLTGQEGPWGPVTWTDFVWPADFYGDLSAFQAGDLDPVEFLSQALFWQKFAKLDPARQGAQWYFALGRMGRYDEADAYLEANPVVATWLLEQGVRPTRVRPDGSISLSWFSGRSPEEAAAFKTAIDGLRDLQETFDTKLREFYETPWSDEYKVWKKLRRAAVETYFLDHPELSSAFGLSRTWQEWQEEMGEWLIDDLFEQFDLLSAQLKPVREKFKDELSWRLAQREYNAWRKAWLKAHPQVADRLVSFRNDVESAWRDQEASWGERLDYANELKIQILTEEAKGAAADRDLIDTLYDISEVNWQALDAEAFAIVYADLDKNVGYDKLLENAGVTLANIIDRVQTVVTLPGFSDFRFANATPSERQEMVATERKAAEGKRYGEGIQKIVKKAKSGGEFYRLLQKDPWLWDQYQKRNPEKARYAIGIGKIIAASTSGRDFFLRLKKDPWLFAQYMARNPGKFAGVKAASAYFKSISRWGRLMEAGKFQEAEAYWKTLPDWVKERYFAKHPEKRARAARSSAYVAAMGRWVDLLKRKDFVAADKHFRGLPTWMRERYFAKHPDARFRLSTDQRLMARAADYFAADDAVKIELLEKDAELRAFLAKNEGTGDRRRALIMAAYRVLDEPWLRRVYRERYPEYFSKAAEGDRRRRSVARDLAANPELLERYQRALRLQTDTYVAQARRAGVAPKPLTFEHLRRHRKRRRQARLRAARITRFGGM